MVYSHNTSPQRSLEANLQETDP